METTVPNKQIEFNHNSILHLNETRRWTLFMSILGFIFLGLCILLVPVLMVFSRHANSPVPVYFSAIPMLLIAVLYFFPMYYLFKFSVNSKKAIVNTDSNYLEQAFKYLKYHYRFMGILLIVVLGMYIVIGLFALMAIMMR